LVGIRGQTVSRIFHFDKIEKMSLQEVGYMPVKVS
jgi:hypothetical protein